MKVTDSVDHKYNFSSNIGWQKDIRKEQKTKLKLKTEESKEEVGTPSKPFFKTIVSRGLP